MRKKEQKRKNSPPDEKAWRKGEGGRAKETEYGIDQTYPVRSYETEWKIYPYSVRGEE